MRIRHHLPPTSLTDVPFCTQQLILASAARTEIVLTTDGIGAHDAEEDDGTDEALRRKAAQLAARPSTEAVALFTPHSVDFGSDEGRKQATVNAHFKLLMGLLKWEKAEGEWGLDRVLAKVSC